MSRKPAGVASIWPPSKHLGFTLVELAISIFIIALLLGSILVPLATQVEQRQISETQKTIEEIKEALIGFALANSYLPCPDSNGGLDENTRFGAEAGPLASIRKS